MVVVVVVVIFIFLLTLAVSMTDAVGDTNSQSQSRSHSQSHSSGFCNATSIEYYPLPQPVNEVNSTFPLWPTKLTISLSGNRLGNNPSGSVGVYIYYNYTYFHDKNPSVVRDCNLAPDFSDLPYVRFIESWREFSPYGALPAEDCNKICVVWFSMKLTCPMTAPSGTYYLRIPGVGNVEFDLTICTNEGSDYGFDCNAIPEACRETSDFMTTTNHKSGLTKADKVGISFGVIGGVMLVVIITLAVLFVQAQAYVERSKRGGGGPLSL